MRGVGKAGRVHAEALLTGLQILTGDALAAPVFAQEALKGLPQAPGVLGLRHGRDCRREGQGKARGTLIVARLTRNQRGASLARRWRRSPRRLRPG